MPPVLPPSPELFPADIRSGGDAPVESLLQTAVETCYRRAEIHFQRRFERPRLTLDLRGMAAAVAHTTGKRDRETPHGAPSHTTVRTGHVHGGSAD